ncbi:MAG: hypothetical protein M3547_09795, partial [Acidobacteriota bacterium]|nr:hypothetical protein [Acidobacteriota bacterium]
PEDYVEIAPRKSVSAVVDLAGPYDVRRAGAYEVAFTRGLTDVVRSGEKFPRPRGEHRRRTLACGPVRIEVAAK